MAIVFSPDLAPPSTCQVYEALGFACYRDADWTAVMSSLSRHNSNAAPSQRIHTIVIETHSANGNALKLQEGKRPTAARSYASVAALDQHLARSGVRVVIVGACNANRLFRRSVYRSVDSSIFDPLLLPATHPSLSVSDQPAAAGVSFLTPQVNQIESLTVADVAELTVPTRVALGIERGRFVISDLLIEVLLQKPGALAHASTTEKLSRTVVSRSRGNTLFAEFRTWLGERAEGRTARR